MLGDVYSIRTSASSSLRYMVSVTPSPSVSSHIHLALPPRSPKTHSPGRCSWLQRMHEPCPFHASGHTKPVTLHDCGEAIGASVSSSMLIEHTYIRLPVVL